MLNLNKQLRAFERDGKTGRRRRKSVQAFFQWALAMADLRQQILRTSAHEVPCIWVVRLGRCGTSWRARCWMLYSRACFGLDTRRVCLPAPAPPENPRFPGARGSLSGGF